MFIYLDEAGNTGGVKTVKRHKSGTSGKLNYIGQPLFVEAAVVANDENDKQLLLKKYCEFKLQFPDLLEDGELKGSSLCTRKNNRALKTFINTLLDDKHFYLNVYDKKFYLATLILQEILPVQIFNDKPSFYKYAEALCEEKDDFFVEYCRMVENPTIENVRLYFEFLINYKYVNERNKVVAYFATILNFSDSWEILSRIVLSKDAYAHHNVSNLINLNCLAEFLVFIKDKTNKRNNELIVEHDRINGIQDVITDELASFGFSISFCDSKDEELIQLADNVASPMFHVMAKVIEYLYSPTLWEGSSQWNNLICSSLMNVINGDHNNIKLTLNLKDQAAFRALGEMYRNPDSIKSLSEYELQRKFDKLRDQYRSSELQNLGNYYRSTEDELDRLRQ